MDEQKVQELWEAFREGNDLGTLGEFKSWIGDPNNRAEFHKAFRDGNDLGTIQEFDAYLGVKKKPSSKGSAFNWSTGEIDSKKLSSTQPAAPTAGRKSDIVTKDGVEMNWGTGEVTPKSAFAKNADSIYQLTVTNQANQPFQEETQPIDSDVTDVTMAQAGMLGVEAMNRGVIEQGIAGGLKGAGELMLKGVKVFDESAKPEDIYLWKLGNGIEKMFEKGGIAEYTSSPELLNSTEGEIISGLGQAVAGILTGGTSKAASAMSAIPKSKAMLEMMGRGLFSRASMMATMNIVGEGSERLREEKSMVDQLPRDGYVKLGIEAGLDEKEVGAKYDRLKSSNVDDLISEMLPTWFMEGSTEGLMVGEWFKRFNKATDGSFGKVFMEKAKDVTIGTFEGATQEALQQWMENATAKEVYDYTLKTTEGLEKSAEVGGAVQFILETMSAALGVKNRGTTGEDSDFIKKAQEEIESKKEVLAKNLDNALVEKVDIKDVKAELDTKVQAGEITQEQADEQLKEIEVKKLAIEKIPEDLKMNPDVVDATTEKTKVDSETDALKESIKEKDPAFTAKEQAQIKENELKSAELSVKTSEAANLPPDPKAVKLIEASKEETGEPAKTTAKEDVSSAEPKVSTPTATPLKEPQVQEEKPPTPAQAKKLAEEKIDEFAVQPEADLSNMPDEDVTRKILADGNTAQVGQAWAAEPDVVQGEIFTKESAIEDAVTNSTFDVMALEGIPDLSSKYLPKGDAGPNVYNLQELAEELSDQTGMNITEADIADYISSNPEKKKPKKISANPNKRLLAQRFKELAGIAPNKEYIDKLSERSSFLKEKQAVEQEFPEAAVVKPVQPASDRMKKSLMNRVAEDPLVPLEVRELAKAGKLDYDSLKDEHVNAVADFEIAENMKSLDAKDGLDASVKTAKDLLKEAVDTDDTNTRETNGAIATTILLKTAYHYAEQGMMAEALSVYDFLDSYSRGAGRQISSLRGSASPEGIAGSTAVKVFESQVRELSKKGKNATLEQMLRGLKDEIEKARSKTNLQEAKVAVAKSMKVKDVANKKVEAAKKGVDEARAKLARAVQGQLSAGINPEVLIALKDLFVAYKNLFGANMSLIKAAYMQSASDMGLDADEAWNAVSDEAAAVTEEELQIPADIPMGTAQPLIQGQSEIDKIVDEHYKKNDGMSLWAKLKEAGMSEKDARAYENKLASELEKREKAAILRAINNFKKQIQEEEIEGIMVHEKKWNGSVDKLANAAYHGLLNDQNLAAAVSGYFGYQSLSAQDVKDIKDISSKMINGLQSNAVVNTAGQTIGYQPIGQPAPAGTTLQLVDQKSPELMARAQKEMKNKLLELEKRNVGIMPILADELNTAMHMGALANTGTWLNIIVGTISKLAPDLISIAASNPVAAVRAMQKISESKANNWKMGFGVFRSAFKDNFSHLDNPKIQLDGQYVTAASLVEVAMVRGIAKYSKMYADATGIDKAKSFGKLVGAILSQAYRIAIAPKAIDAQFTHPVTEFVRFIEAWNKLEQGVKFSELVTPDFANRVAEYGMFTKNAWDTAKSQASAEVAGMKMNGQEVPLGFEDRRAKEIIQQQVRRSEIESAQLFMDQASLRGEMSGFLGVAFDKWQNSGQKETKAAPILQLSRTILRAALTMFMRVAIHGTNVVQKTVPLLGPTMNAAAHIAVNRSLAGAMSSKYVGEKVMEQYPADRQIGNGYVKKSKTEMAKDMGAQVMATTLFAGLFMAMFDRDDEDNLVLDPDRWIDISASLDNDPFTSEVGGMTRYSVRFKQSDGTWGKPKKFSLWLPFLAPLSILGGVRDDIIFREQDFRNKSIWARGGAGIQDIIGVFSEVSFNSLAQTWDRYQKAGAAAAKSDTPMPWVDVTFQTALRPAKAVMPGVYRDLLVNELGVMLDKPATKPDKWYERIAKDIPWIDYYVKGDRYDEYGNIIYRDSRTGKIVERISMGYLDFVMKNEETRERPEWILSSKFDGLLTPGQFFSAKSLISKKDSDWAKKGETISDDVREEMSKRVAERKGLIVNKYYEQLDKLNKQELEQMLLKVHNFASDIIKYEMGFSSDK